MADFLTVEGLPRWEVLSPYQRRLGTHQEARMSDEAKKKADDAFRHDFGGGEAVASGDRMIFTSHSKNHVMYGGFDPAQRYDFSEKEINSILQWILSLRGTCAVPMEPTPEMIKASGGDENQVRRMWRVMLEAAPNL